ncbi:MAG TPA: SpvB/TcaC N-terminal domain-containing protein, partial [Bacteroidales bacterium]|nr:SpvB/TcaC N-terminal domain-containing protein [Bacteroidales bacterium]
MKTTYYLNLIIAFLVFLIGFLTFDIRTSSDYEGFSGSFYSSGEDYWGNTETTRLVPGDSFMLSSEQLLDFSSERSSATTPPAYQSSAFDYCLGSARLIGEPGMLKEDIELTISGLMSEELPPLEMGMVNVTGDYAAYRMLPHGLLFNGDIRIILPYDTTLLPVGFSVEDIHTYYYNEQHRQWQEIERDSIDMDNKLIISRVNHFTDFINAILKTPEMPETQAYTPTTMNDIKVANPLASLNLISPPSPNNKGTANLSYQLDIPSGRQGMNPALTLSYSSDGGNGWMGLGWDISIPSITIDTRWGVPQYRSDKESEIYLMNGEQLATKDPLTGRYNPLPHRAAWVARDTSGAVRYYPRTEGAFQKIIRHGTSPKNYWWEVIDKTGMRYYYGKKLGIDSLDVSAVLCDKNGNIAKWGLTEMRDGFDNFVYYRYDVSNLHANNKYFYIREITYTGHDTTEGAYRIEFIRYNRDFLGFSDVTTNGRLGFLEVNDQLLTEVNIFYQDTIFRGYNFCYEVGAYGKARLKHLSEKPREAIENYTGDEMFFCNNSGKFNLYTHTFEYFNEPETLFSPVEVISYTQYPDYYSSGLLAPIFPIPVPLTGGNTSTGGNIGGALTIGMNDNNLSEKSISGGGNFSYSFGRSDGLGTLIDIDGDGFPDYVFKYQGSLYYRKQINSGGVHSFSQPFLLEGVESFLEEGNTSFNWGLELNPLPGGLPGSIAYSRGKTHSSTFSYFSDVDGDGFPDIVQAGRVFYNRKNANGIRYFETYNSDTIWLGGGCGSNNEFIVQDVDVDPTVFQEGDTIINCYYGKDFEEGDSSAITCDTLITKGLSHNFPGHDAVRMWIVPYDGRVVLSGNAYLTADLDSIRKGMRILDGVKLSVQQNGIIIQEKVIQPDSVFLPLEDTLHVQRGDRFYFRMESLDKRLYDKVYWNPRLTYVGLGTDSSSVEHYVDANGKSQYAYEAAEDFLVHQKQKIYMPYTGTIQIECRLGIKSALSAPVFMKLYQNDTLVDSLYFEKKQLVPNSLFTWSSVPVTKGDSVWFEISSVGNIAWEALRCLPRIYYLSQTTITPPIDLFDTILVPGSSTPIFEYKPSPYFLTFENVMNPTGTVSFTSSTPATLRPMLTFNDSVSGTLLLTVKSDVAGLELEQEITVNNNVLLPDSLQFTFLAGRTYFLDYYTEDLSFAEQITAAGISINQNLLNAGLHTHFPDSTYIFGSLYRGWGQFTYQKDASDNGRIDESVLHLSYPDSFTQVDTNSYMNTDTTTDIVGQMMADSIYDPLQQRFLRMQPDVYQKQWVGYGNITYLSFDTISNTLVSNNQVDVTSSPIPVLHEGERVRAVHKISISQSNSFSLTFGVGISFNWGNNQLYSDFIDMNGDRYPDVVSESTIQYTKPQGGLDILRRNIATFPYMDQSKFYNEGISFGSSFIRHLKETKNSAKNCKNNIGDGNIGDADGNDHSTYTYIDINGDGLPDKLNSSGEAFLNIGVGFHEIVKTYRPLNFIRSSTSSSQNLSLSFNYGNSSIAGNFGGNKSVNTTSNLLTDLNGDGLPD